MQLGPILMGAYVEFKRARGCMTVFADMAIRFVPTRAAASEIVTVEEKETGGLGGGGRVEARLELDILFYDTSKPAGAYGSTKAEI